jgi:transcriptional regulator with XRE-family HTH domain
VKKELPPLCLAVKRFREYLGESQEAFGRRIGVALMTVSRFETGRAQPRDPRVLKNLAKIASQRLEMIAPEDIDINPEMTIMEVSSTSTPIDPELSQSIDMLESCRDLFLDALKEVKRPEPIEIMSPAEPAVRSLREWRLGIMARVATLYLPAEAAAMEQAAPQATALVDEILSRADENQIDYARFEREVFSLAERRALKALKGRKEQQ